VREIRTHGLNGRGLETELRWGLNGHEAGNGGYGQGSTYGPPRQSPTLPAAGDHQGQQTARLLAGQLCAAMERELAAVVELVRYGGALRQAGREATLLAPGAPLS
jgi:hypothetical protein